MFRFCFSIWNMSPTPHPSTGDFRSFLNKYITLYEHGAYFHFLTTNVRPLTEAAFRRAPRRCGGLLMGFGSGTSGPHCGQVKPPPLLCNGCSLLSPAQSTRVHRKRGQRRLRGTKASWEVNQKQAAVSRSGSPEAVGCGFESPLIMAASQPV